MNSANERLKRYIDGIFESVPDTKKAGELKEEMLSNLTEKYNDYVASGLSEDAAYAAAVADLGDTDELLSSVAPGYKKTPEKKNKSVLRWVALGVVLIALGAVIAYFASRPDGPGEGLVENYGTGVVDGNNAGSSAEVVRGRDIDASFDGVTDVIISVESYGIEIREHDYSYVRVLFTAKSENTVTPFVTLEENGVLEIKTPAPVLTTGGGGKLVIYVPEDSALSYDISTASGSVDLDAEGSDVRISTVSGSIKVSEAGTLKIETTSGSVRAQADEFTSSVSVSSVSGSIKIEIDDEVPGYVFDYSTVSGSVRDYYTGEKHSGGSGVDKVGNGSLDIRVTTTSGSIELRDWD